MKKLPMIVLLVAPYIFVFVAIVICIIEDGFTANALGYIGYEYLIMLMVVLIPNMVYAFVLKRNGYNQRDLFFWNMTLKLSYIPIYILIFMLGAFIGMMILGIMAIPFLAVFDYSLLLSSSMYGISGLSYVSNRGSFSKKQVIICGICQFIFVLDVLSAIYLFGKFRREI